MLLVFATSGRPEVEKAAADRGRRLVQTLSLSPFTCAVHKCEVVHPPAPFMRPSEAGTQYPLPRIQLGNPATRSKYKHTRALATALPMEATLSTSGDASLHLHLGELAVQRTWCSFSVSRGTPPDQYIF